MTLLLNVSISELSAGPLGGLVQNRTNGRLRRSCARVAILCTGALVATMAVPVGAQDIADPSDRSTVDAVLKALELPTFDCRELDLEIDAKRRVAGSSLLAKIPGWAAGTVGGRGQRLIVVSRTDDKRSSSSNPAPEGSLRWAVDRSREDGGGWIVFDPSLANASIRLEAPLRVPSNTTIDGGCRHVAVVSAPRISQFVIEDATNVVVSGLSFSKDPYTEPLEHAGDAVSLTGTFDRIGIIHNAFTQCGDGCVDIVRLKDSSAIGRASVAFNRFSRHNKVMLVGSLHCYGKHRVPACSDPMLHSAGDTKPSMLVTVLGNVFLSTSQRHPKVIARAMVHVVNNVVAFAATPYSSGSESAVYGSASASGGILLSEDNVYIGPPGRSRIGAGPISAVSSSSSEPDGAVLAFGNVTLGPVRVVESDTGAERAVPSDRASSVTIGPSPASFARCVSRIAGPQGMSVQWTDGCTP